MNVRRTGLVTQRMWFMQQSIIRLIARPRSLKSDIDLLDVMPNYDIAIGHVRSSQPLDVMVVSAISQFLCFTGTFGGREW